MPRPRPDQRLDLDRAIAYWSSVPATDHGVLGGLPQISSTDVANSRAFLENVGRAHRLGKLRPVCEDAGQNQSSIPLSSTTSSPERIFSRGLDCGAGIGRVVKEMLVHVCDVVDAVEPVASLADVMRTGPDFDHLRASGRLGRVWECPMQEWPPGSAGTLRLGEEETGMDEVSTPVSCLWRSDGDRGDGAVDGIVTGVEDREYDVIWFQWCIANLSDDEVLSLFERLVGSPVTGSTGPVSHPEATTDRDQSGDEMVKTTTTTTTTKPILARPGVIVVKENMATPVWIGEVPDGADRLDLSLATDYYDDTDSSVVRARGSLLDLFDRAGLDVVAYAEDREMIKGLLPVGTWALRPRC